jgi:hypothetical protein
MNTITIDNLGLPQNLCDKIHSFVTNVTDENTLIEALDELDDEFCIEKDEPYNSCYCCNYSNKFNIPYIYIEGTYKFTHGKWDATKYNVCSICMYLALNNKIFANHLSELTTYDEKGELKYKNNKWVIVHPSIDKNKYEEMMEDGEYIDEIFCDF